jgi:hypothetical protein
MNKIIYFIFLPAFLFGQNSYDSYSSAGMDMIYDASRIKYSSSESNHPSRYRSNAIKASIERKLLIGANRRVRDEMEKQRIKGLYEKRLFNKQVCLASAWLNSRTGMIKGVGWWDLSDHEREMYRERYIDYWNNSMQVAENIAPLEREISVAWSKSSTGKNDGRSWKQLPKSEQAYYRNNYLTRKNKGLIPKNFHIPEHEYKEAWLAFKEAGTENKYWHQLTSMQRSEFRKQYSNAMNFHTNRMLALK